MSDYEPKCKKTLPIIFDDRMPVNNLTPKLVGRVNDNTEDLKNLYEETESQAEDIETLQEDLEGKIDVPSVAGTSGQVLTSDGEGGAVWAEVGAGEIVVDPSLTVEGAAADAKKTGDEITHLKQDISELTGNTSYSYTKDKSISTSSAPTQNTEVGWESAVVDCSPGDVFHVKGWGGNTTRLWFFISSVGVVITQAASALHTSDYVKIVAPANATKLCVNSQYTNIKGSLLGGMILPDRVDNIETDLSKINPALTDNIVLTPSSVEENKIYSNSYKTGTALSGYNTYNYSVQSGKVYYISTAVLAASGYAVCYGFKNGVWTHSYGDYPTYSGAVNNFEYSNPYGDDTIKITVANTVIPSVTVRDITQRNIPDELAKTCNNCVKFADNECYIKAKYDGTHDIVLRINKGGGNNLPDIRYVYLVNNSGALNTDIVASRYIISNPSDIFSPSIVAAKQNANGDTPSNRYFTGGNHRTTNVGTGGGVTATNSTFTVYCDGSAVTNWAFGNSVIVKWTNLLNGYNTSKADGSGRNILKEEVTLTIIGSKINVEIVHTALEGITYETYYGLQMICADMNKVWFYGGSNRNEYNPQTASNSGDKNCRDIVLTNTSSDMVGIHIDETDLGNFAKDMLAYSAFTTTVKKSYFGLMYDAAMDMNENDICVVRGYYEFKPKLA